MDRRAFIGTMAGGLLAAPIAAEAQQAGRMYRIGYLAEGAPPSSVLAETLRELRELGYVEGRTLVIDSRFAGFGHDRLPAHAAELVRLMPAQPLPGEPSIGRLQLRDSGLEPVPQPSSRVRNPGGGIPRVGNASLTFGIEGIALAA